MDVQHEGAGGEAHPAPALDQQPGRSRVFVSHGRDDEEQRLALRDFMARFLGEVGDWEQVIVWQSRPEWADQREGLRPLWVSDSLWQRLAEEESESHIPTNELMREGLELALRRRVGLRAVAEWEAEHGELTEEELDGARSMLVGIPNLRDSA